MIRLNDLTIGYGHRILLQHASATIPAGELVALVGRNGTGKSTLLRAIAGFGERLGGEIRLDGHSLETLSPQQLATTVSFVTTERVRIPNLRCEDVVALGRAPYTNWIGRVQEQDKAIVERSLELVGMAAFAGKTMDRMSDGECQRVMIARALAQDTPIILLDEPTSFLDLPNRYELCTLLRRLAHDHRKCILFSTHGTGHRPFALRLDRPDRPTRPALPSDPGYGVQRLHRTAVQQFVRHLRHGERHDQSPQVTDSL